VKELSAEVEELRAALKKSQER